jgi:tetratricopeptide (TPR) repeat protein
VLASDPLDLDGSAHSACSGCVFPVTVPGRRRRWISWNGLVGGARVRAVPVDAQSNPPPPIDPHDFIDAVQPLLESRDLPNLYTLLKTRWKYEQLQGLLGSRHTDARKVALLALGLVAPSCVLPELAKHLKDEDSIVNEMAEHALWSVWFRCGTPEANHQLARGAQALERKDFEHAIVHFDRAAAMCPDFAEAYNQRAIAKYLLERYEESIEDCRRAVERMPFHFGAIAGMGHCHAHLGRCDEAIACYEKALDVNPHLSCVRQAIEQLKGECEAKGERGAD